MKEIKMNMSDIGFGANVLGISHGNVMLNKLKPSLAKKVDYITHKAIEEDMKQTKRKFYNNVYNASLDIYNKNLQDLNDGKFVVTIGGDHSLALGSVKASMEHANEDIGLIWIDAHADINTFEITTSGNIHGMPVASLLGINDEKMDNLGNDRKIKPENIVYLATRAVEEKEQEIITKLNIKELSDEIIKKNTFNKCLEETIEYLKGKVTKVHISLDLDGITPSEIKGVSTPVKGGLDINDPITLVKEVNKHFEIVSLDVVEYNPLNDIDEKTVNYLDAFLSDVQEINF